MPDSLPSSPARRWPLTLALVAVTLTVRGDAGPEVADRQTEPRLTTPSFAAAPDLASAEKPGVPRPGPRGTGSPPADGPASEGPLSDGVAGSLGGTEVDGDLAVEPSGHLRPTAGLLRLCDYFLAATGEAPDGVIEARIMAAIAARAREPARLEAQALAQRYLRFREAMATRADLAALDDPEMAFDAMVEARRSAFGAAAAEAMWGEDEAHTAWQLTRRRILRNADLGPDEQAAQLAAADAAAPTWLLRSAAMATEAGEAGDGVSPGAGGDAAPGAVFAARVARFGAAAAERLAALDAEEEAWAARVADYLARRAALVDDARLTDEARGTALEQLRAAGFDAAERLRLGAYEGP